MDPRSHIDPTRAIRRAVVAITLLGVTAALWWWGVLSLVTNGRLRILLVVAAVVGIGLLAGLIASWLLKGLDDSSYSVDETRALVRQARVAFDSTIRQARVAGTEPVPAAPVKEVVDEFSRLETELSSSDRDSMSSDMLDAVVEQARELARSRANFMAPRAAILHAGKAALDDMREWGVPEASLQRLTTELVPLLASPQANDARAALRALLEVHDQWDPYATWYNTFMGRTAAALLAILLLAIAGAGATFREGHLMTSFALAGIGGAALSVLSRLPPLAAYGAATQYLFRIVSRVGTGFAASLIGAALLATGLITVSLPQIGSFGLAVEECSANPPNKPRSAVSAAANQKGGNEQLPPANAPAPEPPKPCGTMHVLVLLGITMLLGFSERALATFEDRVFPAGTLVPVPVARNDLPPGHQSANATRETQTAADKARDDAESAAGAVDEVARAAEQTEEAAADLPPSPEADRTAEAAQHTSDAADEAKAATEKAAASAQAVTESAAALPADDPAAATSDTSAGSSASESTPAQFEGEKDDKRGPVD